MSERASHREITELKRLMREDLSVREIAKRMKKNINWVWARIYDLRRNGDLQWYQRPISLPPVSLLNSDIQLTPADYYAGRQAMREAGL